MTALGAVFLLMLPLSLNLTANICILPCQERTEGVGFVVIWGWCRSRTKPQLRRYLFTLANSSLFFSDLLIILAFWLDNKYRANSLFCQKCTSFSLQKNNQIADQHEAPQVGQISSNYLCWSLISLHCLVDISVYCLCRLYVDLCSL